jgi:hypothetical protein
MKIASTVYSLAEIVAECPQWHFNIPIYQRLYVWGEDQVLTLLNDLVNAYERGDDLFFLGGTLLVEQKDASGRHFDLIDGQQRFTTLWLLCHAWQEALKPFLTVTEDISTQPRLRFAIRPEVNRFLEALTFGERGQTITDDGATKRMRTALDLMRSVFEKRTLPTGEKSQAEHLTGLTEFVFGKVKFVITTVPRETALNTVRGDQQSGRAADVDVAFPIDDRLDMALGVIGDGVSDAGNYSLAMITRAARQDHEFGDKPRTHFGNFRKV